MDIIDQLLEIKKKNNISKLYEIYNYFFKPPVSVIPIKISKGQKIVRIRPNDKRFKHFKNIKDLSCPPSYKCKTQRANINEFPIFYGVHPTHENGYETLKIAIGEASSFARDAKSEGVERLTYSVWEAIDEITLIIVPFSENYDKLNPKLKELEKTWQDIINQVNYEDEKLKLSEFISAEFSKDNSDYFFSSHYSHFVCNILKREHDGIAYPTVKFEGDGLNVAITSESAKKKLQLIRATECYFIKKKMESFVIYAYDAIFTKNGKTKYIKRRDYFINSKQIENLMHGLRFIN